MGYGKKEDWNNSRLQWGLLCHLGHKTQPFQWYLMCQEQLLMLFGASGSPHEEIINEGILEFGARLCYHLYKLLFFWDTSGQLLGLSGNWTLDNESPGCHKTYDTYHKLCYLTHWVTRLHMHGNSLLSSGSDVLVTGHQMDISYICNWAYAGIT